MNYWSQFPSLMSVYIFFLNEKSIFLSNNVKHPKIRQMHVKKKTIQILMKL